MLLSDECGTPTVATLCHLLAARCEFGVDVPSDRVSAKIRERLCQHFAEGDGDEKEVGTRIGQHLVGRRGTGTWWTG